MLTPDTNWRDLIGKRILIKQYRWHSDTSECRVVEVSPSGDYLKTRSLVTNYEHWQRVDWQSPILVEVLEESPA